MSEFMPPSNPVPYSRTVSDILDLKLNSTAEVLDQILARPDCIGAQVLARLGFSGFAPPLISSTVPSYSMNDLLERARNNLARYESGQTEHGPLAASDFWGCLVVRRAGIDRCWPVL